jgi:hypothetical protein
MTDPKKRDQGYNRDDHGRETNGIHKIDVRIKNFLALVDKVANIRVPIEGFPMAMGGQHQFIQVFAAFDRVADVALVNDILCEFVVVKGIGRQ